jgi:hypothetical protein
MLASDYASRCGEQDAWCMSETLFFVVSLILWGHVASADPLPAGCYVTDTDRAADSGTYPCTDCSPPSCFTAADGSYSFLTPANTSTQGPVDQYGDVVYALINGGYQNAVQGQINYAAYRAQVKLVKKLRAACGARCKRIK